MGSCWSYPPHDPPNTATAEISQTKTQSTSSGDKSDSGKGRFLALSEEEAFPNGQIFLTPKLRIFSLAELKVATRNFRGETLVGEGDSGRVFKGWINEKIPGNSATGTVIAVRKMIIQSLEKYQEWQSEINFWGRLSHPNLVRLLGYCWEDDNLYLVYHFMPKGSLANNLFGLASSIQRLSWGLRLKIAVGAARGLAFLHSLEKQVIYRNFRASNILLDGSYTATISDFALSKMAPSGSMTNVYTVYAAPEYVATGQFQQKSDVYSFGVCLLEIISGRRALDMNRPRGEQNLVDWAKPWLCDRKKLFRVIDTKLEGLYSHESVHEIAQLISQCLDRAPKHRPEMKQVAETLEQLEAAANNYRPR